MCDSSSSLMTSYDEACQRKTNLNWVMISDRIDVNMNVHRWGIPMDLWLCPVAVLGGKPEILVWSVVFSPWRIGDGECEARDVASPFAAQSFNLNS